MTERIEKFKIEDAASYDSFADEFDQFDEVRNPVLESFFSRVDLNDCRRVLDVGTGTGIIAIEAARRSGPNTQIVGIDLSAGLLKSARRKTSSDPRVRLLRMDAETLGLTDNSFDAVLSLFALLHFPNPQRALDGILRALRPGGSATIAFGSAPPWLSAPGLRHRIRRIPDLVQIVRGRLLFGPRFLDQLLMKMHPSAEGGEETNLARHSSIRGPRVRSLMQSSGFTEIRTWWRAYEYEFSDPERFWLLQRVYSSFSRKRLSALSEGERAEVKRVFLERCAEVTAQGGRMVYPYAVSFISGRKPLVDEPRSS
jgi:ubiquinone/menaquinone biosynthesis C-methylase UbiE